MRDRFVSSDRETVVLLVQGSLRGMTVEAEQHLLARIATDARDLGFPHAYAPGMRFGFAGDIATRVQELDGLKNDLGLSGALVSLLVVTAVLLYFRSWRALPILGIPLLLGTTATFALVALPPLSIRHLNSNTAFLGSIVIGNGINSGVILLARFKEERKHGGALAQAIATALRTTWRPTLAAALAASAAYGSLIFTDFRGFNQFGWIGALGMLVCWAAAMLIMPPLCFLLGGTIPGRPAARRGPRGASVNLSLLERPRSLLFAMLLLSVVASIGIVRRHGDFFEYDFSKLRRTDSWASGERYWGKRMDATLERYLTPTLVLANDLGQARLAEQRIERLKDENRAGGLIASVRSAQDVLPDSRFAALEQAQRIKAALTPRLLSSLSPKERESIERALSDTALTPLRRDQIPDTLLLGLREHDGRIGRSVLVYPKLNAGTWDARRIDEYTSDLRQAAGVGAAPVLAAGPLLLSRDIVSAIETDGPRATLIAVFALVIVCALSFRSLGLSVSALFSILAGVVLTVGTLAWSGERLNFSNFVVLPITLGIAADYSINMLKRYQTEGKKNLGAALTATGGAVTLCSITTIIGYGSLLAAQNRALFSFGLFAVAGEVACLVTAILALPAGLFFAESLKKSDKSPRGIAAPHATR
jgi:predicted RND superfamily exporter protein